MIPVSDAFKAEVRRSHTVVSYVDVVTHDNRTFRLDAVDGTVEVDRTADMRRRCSISCVDRDGTITPVNAGSILAPMGARLKVYRGVEYTSGVLAGSKEVVLLGVFGLSKAAVKDQVGGSTAISLDGYDLSRTIKRDAFTDVYTVATGTNVVAAIQTIAERTFPDLTYDVFSSAMVTTAPIIFDASGDPWAAMTSLALGAGCEVYFKADGALKIAPPIDIDHLPAPNWTYIEGDGCQMLDLDVVFTDEPGYNGVVLTGDAAGADTPPVRSIVWDNEPTSPTYHLGPYGEVPMFMTSSVVTTQSDADAAAAAQLNLILGFSSQLDLTAYINPALDANDVIQVVRQRSGVNSVYALDAISIPLRGIGTSTQKLRQKRVV